MLRKLPGSRRYFAAPPRGLTLVSVCPVYLADPRFFLPLVRPELVVKKARIHCVLQGCRTTNIVAHACLYVLVGFEGYFGFIRAHLQTGLSPDRTCIGDRAAFAHSKSALYSG
jgi:hypothetical protein